MENIVMVEKLVDLLPYIIGIVAITVGGWVFTTWLRIKHGYPLESSWGRAIHPHTDKESMERIKLLTTENAQLRAELGSVKDRLETIERIVTDQPLRLAKEIDQLAVDKGGHA
ncbi:MAG TPA: hypothetical protein VFT40_11625 [Sphingomicrobium sp.]|jgi:hypothetical protein|nr:hypothetical protein [Sphingomicrobium sp.]